MKVKEDFFSRGSFQIGNDLNIRFWEDCWLGDAPLAQQYSSLYSIVQRKEVLVAEVLSSAPLNISFRRNLTGSKWTKWIELVTRLSQINLSDQSDKFIWGLTNSGLFSVKSLYLDLMNDNTVFLRKYIWKMKVRLKIRTFMWFLYKRVDRKSVV